jgi:kumamolisin
MEKDMDISKKVSYLIGIAILLSFSLRALAEGGGQVYIPDSSIYKPKDQHTARTFLKILNPSEGQDELNARIKAKTTTIGSPPASGYAYATPASLACIYGLVSSVAQCNPNSLTSSSNSSGGSKAIAIVDAYHYPYALSDLQAFSTQFGLPAPNLTVIYASGSKPATSPNSWEVEEALDLQWAHAMAPNAKLYLVEAASNSTAALLAAVKVASSYVSAAGGGEVSMSWGEPEFSTESNYDAYFQTANVVYFASSGDSAGTGWPCVSPYVVCVGGTTLRRSTTGNFLQEVAWNQGGGGLSHYYGIPAYQSGISTIVGSQRGVPDVALAADPLTGAWLYYTPSNSGRPSWYIVGGTSWSSPTFAGIVNSAGSFSLSSSAELTTIYSNLDTTTNFNDINNGWCYFDYAATAVNGWDECTGVGSNLGKGGK